MPVRVLGHLGRRPAVPPGRAIVGALLITVAAVVTFVAYTAASAGPTSHVVVAAQPLAAGQRVRVSDLRVVAADLPPEVESQVFTGVADLEGAVALAPVDPGAPIPRSAVSTADAASATSTREFSFSVDRDHALDGRIQRGESIDLLATFGSGADARTTIIARRVRVLDVQGSSAGVVGSTGRVTVVVALETQHDVLQAAHAVEVAKVSVVRSTRADPATDDTSPEGSTTAGPATEARRPTTPTTAADDRGRPAGGAAPSTAPPASTPSTTGADAAAPPASGANP